MNETADLPPHRAEVIEDPHNNQPELVSSKADNEEDRRPDYSSTQNTSMVTANGGSEDIGVDKGEDNNWRDASQSHDSRDASAVLSRFSTPNVITRDTGDPPTDTRDEGVLYNLLHRQYPAVTVESDRSDYSVPDVDLGSEGANGFETPLEGSLDGPPTDAENTADRSDEEPATLDAIAEAARIKMEQNKLALEYRELSRLFAEAKSDRALKMLQALKTGKKFGLFNKIYQKQYEMFEQKRKDSQMILDYQSGMIRKVMFGEVRSVWIKYFNAKNELQMASIRDVQQKLSQLDHEYQKSRYGDEPISQLIEANFNVVASLSGRPQLTGLGKDEIDADLKLIRGGFYAELEEEEPKEQETLAEEPYNEYVEIEEEPPYIETVKEPMRLQHQHQPKQQWQVQQLLPPPPPAMVPPPPLPVPAVTVVTTKKRQASSTSQSSRSKSRSNKAQPKDEAANLYQPTRSMRQKSPYSTQGQHGQPRHQNQASHISTIMYMPEDRAQLGGPPPPPPLPSTQSQLMQQQHHEQQFQIHQEPVQPPRQILPSLSQTGIIKNQPGMEPHLPNILSLQTGQTGQSGQPGQQYYYNYEQQPQQQVQHLQPRQQSQQQSHQPSQAQRPSISQQSGSYSYSYSNDYQPAYNYSNLPPPPPQSQPVHYSSQSYYQEPVQQNRNTYQQQQQQQPYSSYQNEIQLQQPGQPSQLQGGQIQQQVQPLQSMQQQPQAQQQQQAQARTQAHAQAQAQQQQQMYRSGSQSGYSYQYPLR